MEVQFSALLGKYDRSTDQLTIINRPTNKWTDIWTHSSFIFNITPKIVFILIIAKQVLPTYHHKKDRGKLLIIICISHMYYKTTNTYDILQRDLLTSS